MHPKILKMILAFEITQQFHGTTAAVKALIFHLWINDQNSSKGREKVMKVPGCIERD